MAGPAYNPEKVPNQEELKKIPKKKGPPKNSKKKCLACKDGLVYDGKSFHACKACDGQGFIR